LPHRQERDRGRAAPHGQEVGMTAVSDLLWGAKEIAGYVFGDERHAGRVYDLQRRSRVPHRFPMFTMGGTLCARRSSIDAWYAEQEASENDNAQTKAA
ncbi:MAG: hypothetical protein ACRED4_02000, partial [Brevundimonas sp.]